MRIVIVTDSLGCARKETHISETWTYKILEKYHREHIFYTYLRHGLSTATIDYELIKEVEPDLVIIQVGTADAFRRTCSNFFLYMVSLFSFTSKIWRKFASKNHFILTKYFNFHKVRISDFERNIHRVIECANGAKCLFFKITQPGDLMIEKVYNCEQDIIDYNMVFDKFSQKAKIVNPFLDYSSNEYLLEDGQHFNDLGIKLCLFEVDKFISENNIEGK